MKFNRLALVCAIAGTLVACGGGGDSTPATTPLQTSRTLDGVAAKGLIKNGVVNVYSYAANGSKSALPLVSSRTALDGSYSVSLGSNIGLFTVEVSADKDTLIADEVSGKDIPMSVGMTMRSLIQLDVAAGASIKGYVTPFTEMIVNAASKATGGLTVANVAAAQTGVTTMLGFNPLETKPVMANSAAAGTLTDISEKLQSIHLAALSKLANDSSNELGCAGSISEKIACVVNATTGSAELKNGNLNISLAAQIAVHNAAVAVAADKTINKTTLANLDGQSTFTQSTVTPGAVIVAPVAATKAMFASLRTNVNAMQAALKQGAVGNPVDTMKADFDKAIAPLDQDLADWALLSARGMDLYQTYADAGNQGVTNKTVQNGNYYGSIIGTCALTTDNTSKVIVSSGNAANNVFCRLERKTVPGSVVPFTRTVDNITTNYKKNVFTKTIQLFPQIGTSNFTYKARTRMETVYFNANYSQVDDVKTTIGVEAEGLITFSSTGQANTNLTIVGDMPARTDMFGVKITDKETWNMNFHSSPEAGSYVLKYAFSGDISSYKDAIKLGSVSVLPGSFLRVEFADANSDIYVRMKEVNFALSVIGVDSKITGALLLNNFVLNAHKDEVPADLKFTGSLSNGANEFFNGTLTAKISNFSDYNSDLSNSPTNFLKGNASFTGILRIANRPDLKLSISGAQNAYNAGSFSGQYEDGANTILISATDASPKVINIASANGVSVQFKEDVNVADVMKNGSKVGSFDRQTGIVTYTDGSFESVK